MELHIDSGLAILLSQDLQRVHGDQKDQQHRQDQKSPKKKKKKQMIYNTPMLFRPSAVNFLIEDGTLTVSPRSPVFPAGPRGPEAPGGPGAPGVPEAPDSPRSPYVGSRRTGTQSQSQSLMCDVGVWLVWETMKAAAYLGARRTITSSRALITWSTLI